MSVKKYIILFIKKQDYNLQIREIVYKYIYNNKNDYLEYCHNDIGKDYLIIENGDKSIVYELDEYISNIKKFGFYDGCIELNVNSKFFNLPIVILKSTDKDVYLLQVVYNFKYISNKNIICKIKFFFLI